jgi:hypothetical protein
LRRSTQRSGRVTRRGSLSGWSTVLGRSCATTDRVGPFMRLRFTLDDDTLEIDSVEMSDMRRAWEVH